MSEKKHAIWHDQFLQQIIESMAEGVFTLDMQGRITSWNPAMEEMSGYSEEEALGRGCNLLAFNRCFDQVCPTGFQECGILKHERGRTKECFLRHKQGFDVPVIKNARAVKDQTGSIVGVVETVTDTTELIEAKNKALEASKRLRETYRLGNIIGKSPVMQEVFEAIRAASASRSTVLIQGESGTGKEMAAAAIHYNSELAENPFVAVNCSALSESLLESELFGHVKGAFTGAMRDKIGRFEQANHGTIFLDEVGELSPYIQVKLLRVLQEREIERVGESRKRKLDIRIIAATNKDLTALVKQGLFREDLYYRMKVFPIVLPLLKDRKQDIPLLIDHFIAKKNKETGKSIKRVSHAALQLFMDYAWPGNIRELENVIEHGFVLCNREEMDVSDLPIEIRHSRELAPELDAHAALPSRPPAKKPLSREALLQILEDSGWNKAEVGRRLGLSRTSVWKYMKKWGIPLKREG